MNVARSLHRRGRAGQIRRIAAGVCAAGALLGLTAAMALAVPITTPMGLNPGDQYRLAFLGSNTTAQSGDIADYNALVTTAANTQPALVALGTTWTAIGSTSTVDARDNTGTNPTNMSDASVPIFLLDGVSKIADDNADLWDGTIDHALNVNQAGDTVDGLNVWTGTASNGTKSVAVNAKELGASTVASGFSSSATSQWIFANGHDDLDPEPLYAISGVLTFPSPAAVGPVPAPILSRWGMIGPATLVVVLRGWRIRRRLLLRARSA